MKLQNTTDFPDKFLRRMVSWCCKKLGHPVRLVKGAVFRNRAHSYSGHAWVARGRFVVSVVNRPAWPCCDSKNPDAFRVRLEWLVWVTAHEIEHLNRGHLERTGKLARPLRGGRSSGGSEHLVDHEAKRVLALYVANRDALLAEWTAGLDQPEQAQADAAGKLSAVRQRRADRVAEQLARWERKLKTAKTKIRKLKARAKYYERTAAKPGPRAKAKPAVGVELKLEP